MFESVGIKATTPGFFAQVTPLANACGPADAGATFWINSSEDVAVELTNAILATGALGTAAFGVVEALKFTSLGNAGFSLAIRELGPLTECMRVAYGEKYESLLRGQYRSEDRDLLPRTLRQGVRIGATGNNADSVTRFLGSLDRDSFVGALDAAENGKAMKADQRNILGRFELAADARIDAALCMARARYVDSTRLTASFVALALALVVGANMPDVTLVQSFIVGLAAVPFAPIAKDVASGISAASKALRK